MIKLKYKFTFQSHWLFGILWYERTIKLEVFGFSSSQQLLPSIAEQLTLESPFSKFSVGDRCGWSKRRRRRRGVNTTKRGRPRRLPAEINLVGNCFPCKLPLFRWWTSGCWRPAMWRKCAITNRSFILAIYIITLLDLGYLTYCNTSFTLIIMQSLTHVGGTEDVVA